MNSLVNTAGEPVLLFGPYVFHVRERQVLRAGRALGVGGRALDILQVLVERAGTVVSKQQIIEQVWPNSVVEEVNLRVHIAALRRALGGGRHGQRYIETVALRGYSFIAQVTVATGSTWSADEVVVARHNLPAELTPLIGRTEEVASLVRQFPARRLMTLTGPAGVGKTRLACRMAELLIGHYRDGVWLLDCTVGDVDRLLAQLLDVLQLDTAGRPAAVVVGEALAQRQCLLLLDSAECLPRGSRQWIEDVLLQAPHLTVLATSRQPLYAAGEWLHRVVGLEVPGAAQVCSLNESLNCSAVQLWVGRAQACQPGYALREQDLPALAEVCRQLDGLPLAIELLAAQLDGFSLAGVQAQLGNGAWLLNLGRRTAVVRHQSLAAALQWSHERLSDQERRLLGCLAAFDPDFSLEAASEVACSADYGVHALRNDLVRLESKSLLVAVPGREALRYRLLNTVRLHALAGLPIGAEQRMLPARAYNSSWA